MTVKNEVSRQMTPRNVVTAEENLAYNHQDRVRGGRNVVDTDIDLTYKHQLLPRSNQIRSSSPQENVAVQVLEKNKLRNHWNATNPGVIRVSGGRRQADSDTPTDNTNVDAIIDENNEYVNSIPLSAEVYEEKNNNNVPIADATILHQYSSKTICIPVSIILLLLMVIVVTITILITNRMQTSPSKMNGPLLISTSFPSPSPTLSQRIGTSTSPHTPSPILSQHIGTYENLILAVDKYLSGG